MAGEFVPAPPTATPAVSPAGLDALLNVHLDRVADAHAALERDLRRCQGYMGAILDVAGGLLDVQDPEQTHAALLRQYASVLDLDVLFTDWAGCCARVELSSARDMDVPLTRHVRAVLADAVEAVRRTRRTTIVQESAALEGARVLLAAFPRTADEIEVLVAMRVTTAPPFDANDVLASDLVLLYGAQVLGRAQLLRHMQRSALETVYTLVNAIDAKDNYTSDHSERVGGLARITGEALGMAATRLQGLEWAGLLHDVGKIGIAEQILNKPGRLTEAEFAQMKNHPRIGYEMLRPVGRFGAVLEAVLYHHENYDGSGYPDHLDSDRIPIEARIIHVADVFDALTTSRPYRSRYSMEQALWVLREEAGRVTDPEVTQVFVEALARFQRNSPDAFKIQFGHLLEAPDDERPVS